MMPSLKCFPLVSKMPTLTYNMVGKVGEKNVLILNFINNISSD
jgi:hypothetical protein